MLSVLQPVVPRLLIVDDHRLFAEGIRFLLEYAAGYEVVGMLHNGRAVIPFLEQHPVDVVLLDIELPDLSGFELAQAIRGFYPATNVLALSMLGDSRSVCRMRDAGAAGYCIKSAGREELFAAIRAVGDGKPYWPPACPEPMPPGNLFAELPRPTNREHEIIRLIVDGASTRLIASSLFLSARTVETHRKNIYRKLAVHTNVELTLYARKIGLI